MKSESGSDPLTLEQFVESLLAGFLAPANRAGVTIDLLSEARSRDRTAAEAPMGRGIGRVKRLRRERRGAGPGREFVKSSLLCRRAY